MPNLTELIVTHGEELKVIRINQGGYSGFSGFSGGASSGFSGFSSGSGYSGFSGSTTSGYSGFSGNATSGFSGFCGLSGYSGYSSRSGYSGFSGISGYSGFSGYSGSGISGYSGYSGRSGYSGFSGFSGYSGFSAASPGASGYSGFSGKSGYSGFCGTGTSGFSGFCGLSGYSGFCGKSGYSGFCGTGTSGFSGFSGFCGLSGYSGFCGLSGYSGFSAASPGSSGYSGFCGLSGYSGFCGLSGYSGFCGLSGYSGFCGLSGYSGFSGAGSSAIAARVYNSGNQSITSGAETVLTFDTENYDTDTIHSTSSNTGRLTATTAGYYIIQGACQLDASALGSERRLRIRLNGTTFIAQQNETSFVAGTAEKLEIHTAWNMSATDYVELMVFQDSTGALNAATGQDLTWFAMTRQANTGTSGFSGFSGLSGYSGYSGGSGYSGFSGGAGTGGNDDVSIFQALGSAILFIEPSFPLNAAITTLQLGDLTCYFFPIYISSASTITGVKYFQVTQGSFTADNNNKVGLYTYSGGTLTLVKSCADDANLWKVASNTWGTKAFSSTYAASVGLHFISLIANWSAVTTAPTIAARAAPVSTTMHTIDFTNSARYCSNVNVTDLPATQAMSGVALQGIQPWLALY